MNKKDLVFIFGLTLFMGVLWAVGEVITGIWIEVPSKFHIIWLVVIVAVTLVISVWHSVIEDESGLKDPKQERIEKLKKKRKNK